MRDENEFAARLSPDELAEQPFLFGLKVVGVAALTAAGFGGDRLCLRERKGGNFFTGGKRKTEQRKLPGAALGDESDGLGEHSRFQPHEVVKTVDKAQFDVDAGVFVEVSGGVVLFGAEDRADLKNAFKNADQHLLVELRALRETGSAAEIVEPKQVGAALGAGGDELRGVNFRERGAEQKVSHSLAEF